MKSNNLKTRAEVLEDFANKGLSVRGWAIAHGLSPAIVHGLLKGTRQGRIGASHKAAILLGLKHGEIVE